MFRNNLLRRSIFALRQSDIAKYPNQFLSPALPACSDFAKRWVRCSFTFFQSDKYFTTAVVPVVAVPVPFEPIKQFIKKELSMSKEEYARGTISNWLDKERYDELDKLMSKIIKQVDDCSSESALKALYQTDTFNALLEKHSNLNICQEKNGQKKLFPWEEFKRQISDLIHRNLTCPKPGLYG